MYLHKKYDRILNEAIVNMVGNQSSLFPDQRFTYDDFNEQEEVFTEEDAKLMAEKGLAVPNISYITAGMAKKVPDTDLMNEKLKKEFKNRKLPRLNYYATSKKRIMQAANGYSKAEYKKEVKVREKKYNEELLKKKMNKRIGGEILDL